MAFQSTLPLRGATVGVRAKESKRRNFNPRSPYGERPLGWLLELDNFRFQSTLPLRGATSAAAEKSDEEEISIHAPLTGSDTPHRKIAIYFDISIHAPLTGSDHCKAVTCRFKEISIHAPLTGSDIFGFNFVLSSLYFNPRSPYGERLRRMLVFAPVTNFNPRSPYGERPGIGISPPFSRKFQSTLPLRGATN